MAEVKNLFIKSKMNKDLDDRLVPSGEYRNAINVMISRSEGGDVGALENVLGNEKIASLTSKLLNQLVPENVSIIGFLIDDNTDRIFLFLTTYIDNSSESLTHPQIPATAPAVDSFSGIVCYNLNVNTLSLLIKGTFLNFSKNSIITGVNLLENLLFWTDNRNQPRKINVAKALDNPDYYFNEDQISVAKYYPYVAPRLWANETCSGQVVPQPQMKNKSNETNPWNYGQSKYIDPNANPPIPTNPNPTYDPEFPGDSAFLEDKFVRFSYRFKYEDDEYSIIAPFTQPAFIPKQDGYFALNLDEVYTQDDGIKSIQEDDTYKSTIVSFMENKVDSINIYIDLPCKANEIAEKFLVSSIEILYKEADSLAVKVLKKIKITDPLINSAGTDEFINWEYQSAKPIQTLPEAETTRVFDRVPVRALSQEIIGNRVVYGNYTTSFEWPKQLPYKVGVSEKSQTNATLNNVSRVEYPNHTLKQNRNYQVGIVLADRFGRQTPVILTPPVVIEQTIAGVKYKGSTIYHAYKPEDATAEDILYWTGDSIKLLFKGTIDVPSSPLNQGLYNKDTNPLGWYSYKIVVKQQEQDYYNVYVPGILDGYLEYTPDSVINTIAHSVLISDNVNKVPRDLREVGPNQATFSSSVRLWGRVNNIATRYQGSGVPGYQRLTLNQPFNTQYYPEKSADQVVTIGTLSDLGLGQFKTITSSHFDQDSIVTNNSIKIFTKKFNNDIFDNSTILSTSTSTNSIPTGSLVKNYRENPNFTPDGTGGGTSGFEALFNIESPEYPFTIQADAALTFTNATFYNSNSNPLIVRMSTKKGLGSYLTVGPEQSVSVLPELAVFETTPTKSALDIYWETSTSGLISELNEEVLTPLGPRDIGPEWRWIGTEASTSSDDLLATDFWVINQLGQQVPGVLDASQSTCQYVDASGVTQSLSFGNGANDFFTFTASGSAPNLLYNIRLNPNKYWTFLRNYAQQPFSGNLTFILSFVPDSSTLPSTFLTETAQVSNVAPTINLPAFIDVPSITPYIWPDAITVVNGTSDTNNNTLQLVGSLTSQVNILDVFTQVDFFEINPTLDSSGSVVNGSWTFSLKPNSPSGTYNLSFEVIDADGIGLAQVATWVIKLKRPGFDGQLKFGDISLPMWSGYYGWFASSKTGSSNEDTSLNLSYCNAPNTAASLPSMTLDYFGRPLIENSWSTATTGFSGKMYKVGTTSQNIGSIQPWQAVRDCNNPGVLGSFFMYADGIGDYFATYVNIEYPGVGICANATNDNKHNQSAYRNYNAYGTAAYGEKNQDVYLQRGGDLSDINARKFCVTWYAPPKNYNNTQGLAHDATINTLPPIFPEVGYPMGWPYIPADGDVWEEGYGQSDNQDNTFNRRKSPQPSSNDKLGSNEKNKKWFSVWGNNKSLSDGNTPNLTEMVNQNLNTFAFINDAAGDGSNFKDWNFGSGRVKLRNIKFRTRVNRRFSPNKRGLESGTALLRIIIDHYNFSRNSEGEKGSGQAGGKNQLYTTNALQEGVLHSNFLVQYRAKAGAPWSEALDIRGEKLNGGIWDSYPGSQAPYGYGSALFRRGPDAFRGIDVRYNGSLPVKDGGGGKIMSNIYGGNMINPYRYLDTQASGYVKFSSNSKYIVGFGTTSYTKNSFQTNLQHFPQGMALRNYSTGSPRTGGQCVAEYCFAFDKKGDYRLVFDNLRQGTKFKSAADETLSSSTKGARPYVVAALINGYNPDTGGYKKTWVGPGVNVTVMDLYNQRPIEDYWGNRKLQFANSLSSIDCPKPLGSSTTEDPNWNYTPEESQLIKPDPDNGNLPTFVQDYGSVVGYRRGTYFKGNKTQSLYEWYAYLVNTTPQNNFEDAVSPDNFNPNGANYTFLFAEEPVFRYVTKFYTRLWSGTEYVYQPWFGTSNTGWFAFSKKYVSFKNNTIPSAASITSGDFPDEAGVPFGDERAFGPLLDETGGGGGIYSTWAVRVESNTGKFLEGPTPSCYQDVYSGRPPWYPDFETL